MLAYSEAKDRSRSLRSRNGLDRTLNSAKVNMRYSAIRTSFTYQFFKELTMDFDFRLLIVLAPLAVAGGWAVFNILPYALKQVQELLREKN